MDIPKIIAFYFPQFHSFPENDKWWGEGFTDWLLVKKAKPNFQGHNQPRVPIDENYYNPCNKSTLLKQAELAKKYGIYGFSFYHYWFDGKLLLETPLETFLANKDINIPFCITWANETWTRCWIGQPEIVLQEQTHTPDPIIWEKHFDYLLPFFKDNRAIKINNRPVIIIYQPSLIKATNKMMALWDNLAKNNGLEGLYYIGIKNHSLNSENVYSLYNGLINFQPREAFNSKYFVEDNYAARVQWLRKLPEWAQRILRKIRYNISSYKIINSEKIWDIILKKAYINEFESLNIDIFETAFFGWDNTPRYGNKANIYTSLNDQELYSNLKFLLDKTKKENIPYIFFNAWNEWSESAYLEPDKINGYKYLEIVKSVLNSFE
jgi:hypothetical protein